MSHDSTHNCSTSSGRLPSCARHSASKFGINAGSVSQDRDSISSRPPSTMKPMSRTIEMLISLIMFNEGIQIYLIYPLLKDTVENWLRVSHDDIFVAQKLGKYASVLTGAYFLASSCSGFLYGLLADRLGRRFVLLSGLFGSAFSGAMFAVSSNFWFAVAARFLAGLLDANLAMLKAYIGDVTTHENQSRVFSNTLFMFGFAVTVAPLVSGSLGGTILFGVEMPVFWPCVICSLCSFAIGFLCLLYLPETESFKQSKQQNSNVNAVELIQQNTVNTAGIASNKSRRNFWSMLKLLQKTYRLEILAVTFYCWMSFILYGTDFVFPLLIQKDLNKGWTGWFLTVQGASWCVFQKCFYPILANSLGSVRCFSLGSFMLASSILAVYFPILFSSRSLQATAMFIVMIIRGAAQALTFTSIVVVVNNSTTCETKGRVTGIAHSLASMSRLLGITSVGGFLWDIGTRWNFIVLPFLAGCYLGFCMFFSSLFLPLSLNRPKAEPASANSTSTNTLDADTKTITVCE